MLGWCFVANDARMVVLVLVPEWMVGFLVPETRSVVSELCALVGEG